MKRTPEEVCIEYAEAAAEVRRHSCTMRENKCEFAEKAYSPVYDSSFVCLEPGSHGIDPCWLQIANESMEDGNEPCEPCTRRIAAHGERKDAKKRLRAAKLAVGSVGKRLIKQRPTL